MIILRQSSASTFLRGWLHDRTDHPLPRLGAGFMVRDGRGRLLMGAMIAVQSDGMAIMPLAADSPRWCTPSVLRELFTFLFHECGATRCTAVVRSDNHRIIRLALASGFREAGRLPGWAPDGATGVILDLLPGECRWLKGEDNVRLPEARSA